MIQNEKDNYCEDIITQKIIYYISLFSEEVQDSVKKLKSEGLIQEFKQKKFNEAINMHEEFDEFLIKLDDVSVEFIYVIMDILDYHELFRLSIMLCNRYKLTDRIGRYLLQITLKYSNIDTFRNDFSKVKLQPTKADQSWKQNQLASSLLAHEALHNVFSLIDSNFLTLKGVNEQLTMGNSLGMPIFRYLLSLGFWKKLVYIT